VAGIDDAAGEPAALVAQRDEALAFGVEANAGQAAETAKARGQNHPAAVFQRAEAHMRVVADIEGGYRPGIDLDRDWSRDRGFVGGDRFLRYRLRRRLRKRGLRAKQDRNSASRADEKATTA